MFVGEQKFLLDFGYVTMRFELLNYEWRYPQVSNSNSASFCLFPRDDRDSLRLLLIDIAS